MLMDDCYIIGAMRALPIQKERFLHLLKCPMLYLLPISKSISQVDKSDYSGLAVFATVELMLTLK